MDAAFKTVLLQTFSLKRSIVTPASRGVIQMVQGGLWLLLSAMTVH